MIKEDGFKDEILIVTPPELYLGADNIIRQLHITDIGYFPQAGEHWIERENGCSSYIIIICTGGSGFIESAGIKSPVKNGEAVVIPAGTPHAYGSGSSAWWEIYWIHFNGTLAGELSRKLSGIDFCRPFALAPGEESRMLFSDICSDFMEGISPLKYDLICSKFWHLAGSLTADRHNGTGTSTGLIRKCLDIMEASISGRLNLDRLSREASVTPQYLCRLFKQKTGQTPIEHYNQMKIQRACRMLDLTELRINEISRQLGFEDQYYFTRVFKRIMGQAPRDYRRRQK